ncbi:hypothetical protein VTK26DRAFT_7405 [Humicola hyalothermophila]
MKFTIAFFAFAAVAIAYPTVDLNAPVKRQNTQSNVEVQAAAMSDENGNAIPFDASKVRQNA